MTDPIAIARADARADERISRENRRQALNHAASLVHLWGPVSPERVTEAADVFARFLDGEGRRDAGTDAAEPVQQVAPANEKLKLLIDGDSGWRERIAELTAEARRIDAERKAQEAKWRDDSETLNTVCWRLGKALGMIPDGATTREAPYALQLVERVEQRLTEKAQTTVHPPVPVTEQHGATERPIRASVDVNRNGAVTLCLDGAEPDHLPRSLRVVVPQSVYFKRSTSDVAAYLADAINGTAS